MGFDTSYANVLSIKPIGAGSFTQIDVYAHNLTDGDEGHEVTSTLHGGYQAFVDSIRRGEITIRGHLTSDGYPWSGSIVPRGKGAIRAEFAGHQPFIMYYFITRVGYSNEVAGGTDFEATFKMNAEAAKLASAAVSATITNPS